MKTNWETPSEDIRIEILPLIDVVFCILTFFIMASVVLTRQSGINVDLPSAATGTTQMREMIIVSIDPGGILYLEQQPITPEQLRAALRTYRQNSPNGLMVLYASRLTRYDDVVTVLDLLRSVGGSQVALATLPEAAEEGGAEFPGLDGLDLTDPSTFDSFEFPDLPDSPQTEGPLPGESLELDLGVPNNSNTPDLPSNESRKTSQP